MKQLRRYFVLIVGLSTGLTHACNTSLLLSTYYCPCVSYPCLSSQHYRSGTVPTRRRSHIVLTHHLHTSLRYNTPPSSYCRHHHHRVPVKPAPVKPATLLRIACCAGTRALRLRARMHIYVLFSDKYCGPFGYSFDLCTLQDA